MIEIFVVDRIENDLVILQNLASKEFYDISKDMVIGDYKEKSVVIKKGNEYIFSEEETIKREHYIKSKFIRLLN